MPDRIGPYRVLRPIARGGMAEVYEVEDPSSGEHLALKLLVQAGGATKRFNREYEAMTRLNHPNIVRVYHFGFHGKQPWITMEHIEGTPVQAYAKKVGRPGTNRRMREVVRIIHDIALALDHIHFNGLIHRDLKSANVLVLPDGRVKLLDFGTAKVLDAMEAITKDGEFVGTFAYASPEQLTGQEIDHRADLYSLGVLFYRMATGRRPFNASDLSTLARQHVKEAPKPPTELTPTIPPAVEAIILSLLAKKADARPQTGREVAEALEALAGQDLLRPSTLDVDLSGGRLIGREEQLGELFAFLDRQDPMSVCLVVGPQGSGRDLVMRAVEQEVANREWRGASVFFRRGGDDLAALAKLFGELGASLGGALDAAGEQAMSSIEEVSSTETLSAANKRDRLRDAGAVLLRMRVRSDGRPLVLFLRGLQHAGPVAFDVIVGLREELSTIEPGLLILADCLETADDPESLARKRLPDGWRIRLDALSSREVALYVGSLLHRRPPPAVIARQIHEASGGLPTYVGVVVKGMVADGILAVKGQDPNRIEWASRGTIQIPVPEDAEQRVIEELGRLPSDRLRVLQVLSLTGGETAIRVIAAGLDCPVQALAPAVEDLASQGWVNIDVDNGEMYLAWRRFLAERVVLDSLHPSRRNLICRLVAREIADDPPYAAQIKLFLEAGRLAEAVERGVHWGRFHLEHSRPLTALEVLEPLLEAVRDAEAIEPILKAQIYLTFTSCLLMARPTDRRLGRTFQRAMELGKHGDQHFRAELELTKARIQRAIGHYRNFEKHLVASWDMVSENDSTPLAAVISNQLGWVSRMFGLMDESASWAGRCRQISLELEEPSLISHGDVTVAGWQYAQGQLRDAEKTARGALQQFADLEDIRGMSLAVPVWTDTLRQQCRYSEALEVLYAQLPIVREHEAPTYYVRYLLATGWCEIDLGRLGRAQECVDELAAILRPGEHLHLRLEANLMWGRILSASGQFDDALVLLSSVEQKARAANMVVTAELASAFLGEVYWHLGNNREMTRRFNLASRSLRRAGEYPAALEVCIARARVLAEGIPADDIFAPVDVMLEDPSALRGRFERELAQVRNASRRGGTAVVRPLKKALQSLEKISSRLNETDRSAMRVHPWARTLRLAGLAMGRTRS